ncbi:unnamed protein product [Danaus chrysippus]|uniref:Uncharacterized protein n=2 Tax=Danaus TaxID=13036 RepID=A0A212ERW7_DANPL|nr:uncharacterized protein LOC116766309 [Danaus plexippus]OWR44191.1 hypothetical protein KGM_200749 [Danaus plexippus plexippus]CAG9563546.1 unnamed protein product [Danaus chrysippus]
MNFYMFLMLFGYFFTWSSGMLYRRDSDNVLKPDLLPVSSTVMPLPYYSVYGFEKKLLRDKNKKRPQGKISLVTKQPK